MATDYKINTVYKVIVKPCPFCGKIHRVASVGEIHKYDNNGEGIVENIQPHVFLDCINERYEIHIPLEIYNNRPLEK